MTEAETLLALRRRDGVAARDVAVRPLPVQARLLRGRAADCLRRPATSVEPWPPVVEVRDLRRTYRTNTGVVRRRPLEVEAVRGISFEVGAGELFGLLGPNGAGKTTTIKMLITLLLPTSGEARVLGLDVVARRARGAAADRLRLRRRPRALRAALGLRQPPLLRRALRRHRAPAAARGSRRCSSSSGSTGREQERVEGYSRGMRQRLHIARGIIHDPEVRLPRRADDRRRPGRRPRAPLDDLRARPAGKTVLLTTHYMFEADTLCDRVAVIAKGRLVARGNAARAEGRTSPTGRVLEVEVFGDRRRDRAAGARRCRA